MPGIQKVFRTRACIAGLSLFASAFAVDANDMRVIKVLESCLSPDGRLSVAKIRRDDGNTFAFIDSSTYRLLGDVLSASDTRDISNIAMLASWNEDKSKVAVLIHYGTKGSAIKIFVKDPGGAFNPVRFDWPDAISVFEKLKHVKLAVRAAAGAPEDTLGPWITKDVICLNAGDARTIEGVNKHVFVRFKVRVKNRRAKIIDASPFGIFSDQKASEYLENIGSRYWHIPEESQ